MNPFLGLGHSHICTEFCSASLEDSPFSCITVFLEEKKKTSKDLDDERSALAGCNPVRVAALQLLLERILNSPLENSKQGGGPGVTRDYAFLLPLLSPPLFSSKNIAKRRSCLRHMKLQLLILI